MAPAEADSTAVSAAAAAESADSAATTATIPSAAAIATAAITPDPVETRSTRRETLSFALALAAADAAAALALHAVTFQGARREAWTAAHKPFCPAGARRLPHVSGGRCAPQVLGLQRQRPARRRHDVPAPRPDHHQRRRRSRAAGARTVTHLRVRDSKRAPQVLGPQLLRLARRQYNDRSPRPDHDRRRRRRRAAGARKGAHVRVRDGQRAPQVLGLQRERVWLRVRPARRWHDDQSQHPDHDRRWWRRRAAGARRLPHVRVRDGRRRNPQVLGFEHLRPARRRHEYQSQHPDHNQRRRRRRAAGARIRHHVRVLDGKRAPQVLGLQQRRPARQRQYVH